MTTRTLARLASIRQADRKPAHPDVIVGPFTEGPGTEFQREIAQRDRAHARAELAAAFISEDDYIGDRLRRDPAPRAALSALPGLLLLARNRDGTALVRAVLALADALDGPASGSAAMLRADLWDALMALALTRKPPPQDPADVVDALRLLEAMGRARAVEAAEEQQRMLSVADAVASALTAVPVLPPWVILPVPGSPAARGIRPAGVADLLLIQDTLVGYEYERLSFVENVLRTEKKERTYRRLDRSVDSYSLTTTDVEEAERDLQTTQRSELASEIAETVASDASISAGVNVSASYGPFVNVDTNVSGTLGTSSETSTSVSRNYVQEVVDRSVTKVSSSIQERVTQRVLAETEETTLHGFSNQTEADVVGWYRWLEEVWQAQIMNYGRRLIIELPVPEPGAQWRAARDAATAGSIQLSPPYPIGGLTPAAITATSYGSWVSRYGVSGVAPPPAETITINKTFELLEREHIKNLSNGDFVVQTLVGFIDVPDGYVAVHASADESKEAWDDTNHETELRAHVGGRILDFTRNSREADLAEVSGQVEVAIYLYNFQAATVDVLLECRRTDEAYAAWQVQTFEKIYQAYQLLNDAYLAEVSKGTASASATSEQLAPESKRLIEREELQRCALTVLTGSDFSQFDAVSGPDPADPDSQPVIDPAEALVEGATVLFHQVSLEWENLAYTYYPYFWGRKDNWYSVMGESDPDPLFESFLRAGFARVQVPVRPGMETAVLYYLWTGSIWSGGSPPAIDDPLYVPLVEEIAEASGYSLSDPVPYGEPWSYRLPTTLVALAQDVSDLGL
jgi:hypothetical protein